MKTQVNDEGYLKLKLTLGPGRRREFFVHRLVLMTFVGFSPPGKPYGCHKDRDRTNNRVANLYWGSHQENHEDKVNAGTHRNGCVRKLSKEDVKRIRRSSLGTTRLAAKLGLSISHVREIRNGRKHQGTARRHPSRSSGADRPARAVRAPSP